MVHPEFRLAPHQEAGLVLGRLAPHREAGLVLGRLAPHREADPVLGRLVPHREADLVLVHRTQWAPHREADPPSGRLVGCTAYSSVPLRVLSCLSYGFSFADQLIVGKSRTPPLTWIPSGRALTCNGSECSEMKAGFVRVGRKR